MKITKLRVTPIEYPLDPPIGFGRSTLHTVGCVLVFLETDEGLTGEGLLLTRNSEHLKALHEMVLGLEDLIVGLDSGMSGSFSLKLASVKYSLGAGSVMSMVCASIECALLDLRAKAADLNISQFLGACRTAVPVYQSSDLWVNLSIDELVSSAQNHLDKGFKAMKVRLTGNARDDVERLQAIRDVIGPGTGLMADANQKLTVPQAIRLGRKLEAFDLLWLEEPVQAHDHQGTADVARALDIPIACGESLYTVREAADLLERRAASVLMPDLQRIGGPIEFLKAAALAEVKNVAMSSHLFPEMSLALLASIPHATVLEYMPWASPVYAEQLELDASGNALVPDRPGWGFSFNPDFVAYHTL